MVPGGLESGAGGGVFGELVEVAGAGAVCGCDAAEGAYAGGAVSAGSVGPAEEAGEVTVDVVPGSALGAGAGVPELAGVGGAFVVGHPTVRYARTSVMRSMRSGHGQGCPVRSGQVPAQVVQRGPAQVVLSR